MKCFVGDGVISIELFPFDTLRSEYKDIGVLNLIILKSSIIIRDLYKFSIASTYFVLSK
jgi:hypothetical protein